MANLGSQPEKTYHRQTASERKECAVRVTREYAQEVIFNPGMTVSTETNTADVQPPVATITKLAQFVGLIEEGSTLRSPKILIGQLHSFLANGKVSLLWYKAYRNYFKLDLDGEQWIEDVNGLVPLGMTSVRNKPGLYRLTNILPSIQKSFTDD